MGGSVEGGGIEGRDQPKGKVYRAVGIALSAGSAALFGLLPIFARTARDGGYSPEAVLVFRFGLSAAAIGLVRLLRREKLRPPREALGPLALAGILGYAATALLLFLSYEFMPTGPATTVHFLYPAAVAAAAVLTGREKPAPATLAAAVLGIAGLAIAAEPWNAAFDPRGTALALASALTYAFYVVLVADPRLSRLPRFQLVFWVSAFAFAGVLAGSLASGRLVLGVGAPALGALGAMALLSTVVAVAAFAEGIARVGPTAAAVLSTLEPLTAVLVGMAFLGERPGATFAFGAALVLCSGIAVALGKAPGKSRRERL